MAHEVPAGHGTRTTADAMAGAASWWRDARDRLLSPFARRWYRGAFWGLIYLVIPVVLVWAYSSGQVVTAVLMTVLVVLIGAAYVVIPPLIFGRGPVVATLVMLGFIAFTCLAFPLVQLNTLYFGIYVPIMVAFSFQPRAFTYGTLVVVVAGQLAVAGASGQFSTYWISAAITASVSVMMIGIVSQIQTIIKLRQAQAEIARLAIVDERERFARDMHDVLGHSLTVVTVKAELARKLVGRDTDRVGAELEDIERLSRSALADLRAAVAGYREMGLPTELSAASAALVAAEITPHLPVDSEVVEPGMRELFAWVLRESVTNIIRHSGARNCWVALEPARIAIGDDGRGGVQLAGQALDVAAGADMAAAGGTPGSGLAGLAVRASKAGARLTVRPGDAGGTLVVAERVHA